MIKEYKGLREKRGIEDLEDLLVNLGKRVIKEMLGLREILDFKVYWEKKVKKEKRVKREIGG